MFTSWLVIKCLITSSGSKALASERQHLSVRKVSQQTRKVIVRTCSQKKARFSGNFPCFTFSFVTECEVGRRDFSSLSLIVICSSITSSDTGMGFVAPRLPSPNYLYRTGWAQQCTMQLSIEIGESKIFKSKGPVLTQFCSKFKNFSFDW